MSHGCPGLGAALYPSCCENVVEKMWNFVDLTLAFLNFGYLTTLLDCELLILKQLSVDCIIKIVQEIVRYIHMHAQTIRKPYQRAPVKWWFHCTV